MTKKVLYLGNKALGGVPLTVAEIVKGTSTTPGIVSPEVIKEAVQQLITLNAGQ